jgi:hypothetical protein
MALNTAIRWRLITVNAATLIEAPRTASREIRPLTPDEAKALLVATREHPLDAFVTVGLACGLRLGEALGLQWTDVNLDAGTLEVRRAVQRFGGDATARRPLIAERKRLRAALKATERTRETAETRASLTQQLQKVRAAFAKVKTSIHFTELKSARSRRTMALRSVAITALRSHRVRQLEARLAGRRTMAGPWLGIHERDRHAARAAERHAAIQRAVDGREAAEHPAARSTVACRVPDYAGFACGSHANAVDLVRMRRADAA